MVLLVFIIGILLGVVIGTVRAKRQSRAIDSNRYRELQERWQKLLAVAHENGRFTDEQFEELRGSKPRALSAGTSPEITQELLDDMSSADRRDLEVDRAEKGLPRRDNMVGMSSSDKREVIEAHAENE